MRWSAKGPHRIIIHHLELEKITERNTVLITDFAVKLRVGILPGRAEVQQLLLN